MRIWDIEPKCLCKDHLLGEHRELHAVWSILTNQKKGYSRHPETKRWEGKLRALYSRHQAEVAEMQRRGWKHYTDLDKDLATGTKVQDTFIDPIEKQREILSEKNCPCKLNEN